MSDRVLQGGITYTDSGRRPLANLAERAPDAAEATRRNNDALSASIRVAMPAKVVSWNPEKQTISAQPTIREKIVDRATGTIRWETLPVIPDVPLQFPQGGNFALTFPVKKDDEVLLIFNDLCIDSWWASGGIQNWNDRRRHDLSDAVAILGINSVPEVIPDISTDALELRQKQGSAKVSIDTGSIIYGGLPVGFDALKLEANGCDISFSKTIKVVLISGVPTPILLDTIDINAPRVRVNGVDLF